MELRKNNGYHRVAGALVHALQQTASNDLDAEQSYEADSIDTVFCDVVNALSQVWPVSGSRQTGCGGNVGGPTNLSGEIIGNEFLVAQAGCQARLGQGACFLKAPLSRTSLFR